MSGATLPILLFLAGPAFETFDAPLDPQRWFIGTGERPRDGRLRLDKGAWIAARGLSDEGVERIEIRFRHRGGDLQLTFHDRREPLASPTQPVLVVPRAKGDRILVLSAAGARVDGEPLAWKGELGAAFRIEGRVELDEIRISPAPPASPEPSGLERNTLFWLTSPERHLGYRRVTLTLWDVPVCFLLKRGPSSIEPLQGPGGPVLGWLVSVSDGKHRAETAAAHPLAMRDWNDERGNLDDAAFREYLAGEYALFELLGAAQRVMNESVDAKKLEPLIALAVIRHANNARAAVALAETQKRKAALKLLEAELPKGQASSDQVRAAAARAARKLVGTAPGAWHGFTFDPQQRYATLQEAREHLR